MSHYLMKSSFAVFENNEVNDGLVLPFRARDVNRILERHPKVWPET